VADEKLAQVAGELSLLAERLDEIAFDALCEAVERGGVTRPEVERRAVRARNAIERARRILEDDGSHEHPDDQP
jgi:hypothetical protein